MALDRMYRPTTETRAVTDPPSAGEQVGTGARKARLLGTDVILGGLFVLAVTTGAWVVHGGPTAVAEGGRGTWLAIGQLTGLWAGLLAWAGIIASARPMLLERRFGLDGLLRTHRWIGMSTVFLVIAHVAAIAIAGRVDDLNPVASVMSGLKSWLAEPWMVSAAVAAAIFLAIGLTSWRRLRKRFSYETWYFLHLTGYLALLLAVGHQFTAGTDISTDPFMLAWWTILTVGAAVTVVFARVRNIERTLRLGQARVTRVAHLSDDLVAITVDGRKLHGTRATAGHFYRLRVLSRELWWQQHPISLSAAPTRDGLRFTIKALGDGSSEMQNLSVGTRVLLSGPYGRFTAERAHGRPVVLIGGGVGLTPLRAILEDCRPSQSPVVLARAGSAEDVAHRDELRRLTEERGGRYLEVLGPSVGLATDPFGPALAGAVPDLSDRDAFVCGSNRLTAAAVRGLRQGGVSSGHIHTEPFVM